MVTYCGLQFYLAAVHDKDGQPHVHIVFWDRAQDVATICVDPNLPNAIRESMESKELAKIKEQLTFEAGDGIIEDNDEYVVDNSNEVRKKLIKRAFANEQNAHYSLKNATEKEIKELSNSYLKDLVNDVLVDMPELLNAFDNLDKTLGYQKSMKYGSLPLPMRKEVDKFAQVLISSFPSLAMIDKEFTDSTRLIAEMYYSMPYEIAKDIGEKRNRLDTDLGNAVLNALKKHRAEMSLAEHHNEDNEQAAERFHLSNSITSVFRLMRDYSNEQAQNVQNTAHLAFGRGDLSKDQIRELIYKLEDKENER